MKNVDKMIVLLLFFCLFGMLIFNDNPNSCPR